QRITVSGSMIFIASSTSGANRYSPHPLWRSTPQYIKLMSKDEDFRLQRGTRPEQSDHGASNQPEEIAHRNDYQPIRSWPSAVFGLRQEQGGVSCASYVAAISLIMATQKEAALVL